MAPPKVFDQRLYSESNVPPLCVALTSFLIHSHGGCLVFTQKNVHWQLTRDELEMATFFVTHYVQQQLRKIAVTYYYFESFFVYDTYFIGHLQWCNDYLIDLTRVLAKQLPFPALNFIAILNQSEVFWKLDENV